MWVISVKNCHKTVILCIVLYGMKPISYIKGEA
jgi:hypothetical protein